MIISRKSVALTLLMLLLHAGGMAQKQYSSFHIKQLGQSGVVLNKGWKFYAGDHPDFAKPDFEDQIWIDIDPTGDYSKQISEAKPGIYWIRLRFHVDSSLLQQQYAVWINQYLASELYINGRLIRSFGIISNDPKKVKGFNPSTPVAISLDQRKEQVWALRYAFQPDLNFFENGFSTFPLFHARIVEANAAFRELKTQERKLPLTNTFRIGAFFILAVLNMVFFLFNPAQKAFIFFFFYAIFAIVADTMQFNLPSELESLLYSNRLTFLFWRISNLLLMAALYTLLNQKKNWVFWSLVLLGISSIVSKNWNISIFLPDMLINIELVRTGLKASRLNVRGSWIITAGAVGLLVFMSFFYIGVFLQAPFYFWPIGNTYQLADLLYAMGTLSIPVATTLYIALNYAFTSQSLQQKLIEVNALSQKTLEQEKEKQMILQQVNETLENQVAERTHDLQRSLSDLKSTQAQLIQSEKMASLGELTAGIAHEIQNPLNFVNNFAEVNTELDAEGRDALKRGNLRDAEEILDALAENNAKILHHGKRADAIVKGMLQHSQKGSGSKEPTNINALADEYLRMAYHGLKAKDKSFNATIKTDFDQNIGNIMVVPQDMGRVLLNLINNAFYAVNEKKKQMGDGYEPEVTVTTKRLTAAENPSIRESANSLMISVRDNGNGIPENIRNKIFQPFFTTKPTGEGTGLGLSLSYDIVKAHGGDIKVDSKDGAIFNVVLPV